jgi:glycosyltransferase involved in cell wall biosynthesis
VDPHIFAPSPTDGRRDRTPSFLIGYVGRLVPEKGVDLLLEAVAGMDKVCQLTIVGTGTEQVRLETLVRRLGLTDRVFFRGCLPSSHMPAFYRQLDTFVLPSRSRPNWIEQFGRVLIEAMACGVPVVGADCGEIPHVIGDAGFTFPEGDAVALQEHLTRLLNSPDVRAERAKRGRKRILDRFTQAKVAAQTVKVYREIVTRDN